MRKILYWYVPLALALIATVVFAGGFYSYLRGDTGAAVTSSQEGDRLKPVLTAGPNVVPIILGDSLARGTGDESGLGIGGRFVQDLRARHIATDNIVNLGINGARTDDLLAQLDHANVRTLLAQANAIIVSIGGNDLRIAATGTSLDPLLERVVRVVERVRGVNAKARIFVVGLYNPFRTTPFGAIASPIVGRWNARLADRFASDPNIAIVPTADIFEWRDRLSFDHFHPNGEGYELIARRIADTF